MCSRLWSLSRVTFVYLHSETQISALNTPQHFPSTSSPISPIIHIRCIAVRYIIRVPEKKVVK